MRRELFHPSAEGQLRLLLLIQAFSGEDRTLEGRTKLAKLDFLLRYPHYLRRALLIRRRTAVPPEELETMDVETRMVRFRYGPWDPAYFALLGSLIGRGLVVLVPEAHGLGFRTTEAGRELTTRIAADPDWAPVAERCALLRQNFDQTGTSLKNFIYRHFPEVVAARWGETL